MNQDRKTDSQMKTTKLAKKRRESSMKKTLTVVRDDYYLTQLYDRYDKTKMVVSYHIVNKSCFKTIK